MPWTIGAFTFPSGEEPSEKTILRFDGGEQRWSEFDPIGSNITILTYLGSKSQPHEVYAIVSEASKDSLKAIYDARSTVTFIHPWDVVGVTVLARKFVAKAHPCFENRWEVWVQLLER